MWSIGIKTLQKYVNRLKEGLIICTMNKNMMLGDLVSDEKDPMISTVSSILQYSQKVRRESYIKKRHNEGTCLGSIEEISAA